MLRVEASNLPSPRGARSRRLRASAPPPPQVARESATLLPAEARPEMLPPPSEPRHERSDAATPNDGSVRDQRWSVRIELQDSDVAKLYGQGLARGALVWKRGMRDWRPLLVVPELTRLLRRTRIALTDAARSEPSEPVTQPRLPAPARLPAEVALTIEESGRRVPITVSPTAIDVPAPAPRSKRRHYELGAAALAGFAIAWFMHSAKAPPSPSSSTEPVAAAQPRSAEPFSAAAPAVTAASTIPLVSLSDLPVASDARSGTAPARMSAAATSRHATASNSGSGPSRADLIAALSRVAGAASGCGEREGPVRAVITFAPSGVARSIQVSGAGLPSSTRACIIGAASRARVPAFVGEPVTVSKTL